MFNSNLSQSIQPSQPTQYLILAALLHNPSLQNVSYYNQMSNILPCIRINFHRDPVLVYILFLLTVNVQDWSWSCMVLHLILISSFLECNGIRVFCEAKLQIGLKDRQLCKQQGIIKIVACYWLYFFLAGQESSIRRSSPSEIFEGYQLNLFTFFPIDYRQKLSV